MHGANVKGHMQVSVHLNLTGERNCHFHRPGCTFKTLEGRRLQIDVLAGLSPPYDMASERALESNSNSVPHAGDEIPKCSACPAPSQNSRGTFPGEVRSIKQERKFGSSPFAM